MLTTKRDALKMRQWAAFTKEGSMVLCDASCNVYLESSSQCAFYVSITKALRDAQHIVGKGEEVHLAPVFSIHRVKKGNEHVYPVDAPRKRALPVPSSRPVHA